MGFIWAPSKFGFAIKLMNEMLKENRGHVTYNWRLIRLLNQFRKYKFIQKIMKPFHYNS